jgi:hypothetical protein
MTFLQIAEKAVERNETRVIPIVIGEKKPAITWKGKPIDTASTEEWKAEVAAWIDEQAAKFPDLNCAVIAKPGEHLFIDEDDSATFRSEYELFSGEDFPRTYSTSARTNRLQSHWLQTDATRRMGNIGQDVLTIASVRQKNLYVLAEGSRHKNGVDVYKVVDDSPIIPMPDSLVNYLLFLKKQAGNTNANVNVDENYGIDAPVPVPSLTSDYKPFVMPTQKITAGRNNACKSFAAHVWYYDLTPEQLREKVYAYNQEWCEPPLDEKELDETVLASTVKNKQRRDVEPPVYHDGKLIDPYAPVEEEMGLNDTIQAELNKMHAAGASAQAYLEFAIKMSTAAAATPPVPWRSQFRSVGELESGDVTMLIEEILPEGLIFIGGLPGEGKSLLALSMAKALTSGKAFLGQFDVPNIVPVLYMIPESGAKAFRKRCETFQITDDPGKFLCRTLTEGATLSLRDPSLLDAVRNMKPVLILDTVIRFSESADENASMQNKQFVDDVVALRQAGAVAVIGIHHATKAMRKEGMKLETVLRGTGDIAASADAVYGLLRDEILNDRTKGPEEVEIMCVKARDFATPSMFRLALTKKADSSTAIYGSSKGIISVINERHDFEFITVEQNTADARKRINQLVQGEPQITVKELSEATGESVRSIHKILNLLGWEKQRGGSGKNKSGAKTWQKTEVTKLARVLSQPSAAELADDGSSNTVSLD